MATGQLFQRPLPSKGDHITSDDTNIMNPITYQSRLHPGLELSGRVERLQIRLTIGIPGSMVDLGREAGQDLSRRNYLALAKAGLTTPEDLQKASDDEILACVEQNKKRLQIVREAARKMALRTNKDAIPVLAPYVA